MLRDGSDRLSEDAGRVEEVGRLAGRLVLRRDAGRDFGAVGFGRDIVERGLAVAVLACAAAGALTAVLGADLDAELRDLVVVVPGLAADDREAEVRDFGRVVEADLVAGLRLAVVRALPAALRAERVREPLLRDPPLRELVLRELLVRELVLAAGWAEDIDLAAAVRALAAVVMALVAVFIDCIAVDIVFADAFALVAAAVILVAADVTLVAAVDTVFAAAIGVAELRLVVLRRAALLRVVRDAPEPEREAVERDAVDRDAVLRVDRDALLRDAGLAAERRAVVRPAVGFAADDVELELEFGRLAVPLDALRLTDLRAVLAELRRLAARVVD